MQFYAERVDWAYVYFKQLWLIDPAPIAEIYDAAKEADIYNTQIGAVL